MPSNLDRIRNLIKDINLEAEKTASLFRELDRIVSQLHTAGRPGLLGNPEEYAKATAELFRYYDLLQKVQRVQQTATFGAGITPGITQLNVTPGATIPGKIETDKAREAQEQLAARQAAFVQSFGVTADAARKADSVLSRYGLSLQNLSMVYNEPITQTKVFTFATKDAAGIVSKATLAIDRFGNVIGSSATKFRSFDDMVTRNIGKVLEWAIAVGVVYGAYAQLSQAVTYLREINEQMADLTIATGKSGENLTRFFNEAVQAARLTGTSLDGVLGIYDDAIRATSAITDQTLRYETANTLLVASLKFSRLAGVDQASAMDTIVGALRQLGPVSDEVSAKTDKTAATFQRSQRFLDVLAYTSKGVIGGMNDLAQTFAITGAAAASAGVEMEDLAAMAAVLSESTGKSATEVGNTIRRMIVTIQSESGQQALLKYGIAFEDVAGEAREFDDIMGEIAAKYKTGVISETALRELGYALGGGARGGADIQAIIKNYDLIVSKADAARKSAAGAADEQLAAKYATLNTAINALSVSFKELIQTLGEEGGLVDVLTVVVNILDGVVQGITDLVDAVGPAATRIGILVASLALLQRYSPRFRALTAFTPFSQAAAPVDLTARLAGGAPLPGKLSPAKYLTSQAGALAPAAVLAGMNLLEEGPVEQKLIKAGTTMAGAVIGTLTGAGPIVGAIIGDAAGSALFGFIEKQKLRKADILGLDEGELRGRLELFQKELTKAVQPAGLIDMLFGDEQKVQQRFDDLITDYQKRGRAALKEALPEYLGFERPEVEIDYFEKLIQEYIQTKERLGELGVPEEASTDALERYQRERYGVIAKYNQQALANTSELTKKRQELLEEFIAGDITRKEYTDFVKGAEDATNRVGLLYDELGGEVEDDLLQMQLNFAQFSEEARDELISVVTTIQTLEDEIASLSESTDPKELALVPDLESSLEEQRKVLERLYQTAGEAVGGADPFKFKGFSDFTEYTKQEFDEIIAKAKELQETYFNTLGIPEEVWRSGLDAWVAAHKGGFEEVEDVYSQFPSMIERNMEQAKKATEKSFNLQRLRDIGPEQIPELQKRVRYWERYLSEVPGYADQAESQPFNLIFGEGNTFKQLITTQEALRFAIEDLTEVEKQQLEGMWNIPEGATVMVPLQSLYYAPKGGGGLGAGVPENEPGITFGGGGGVEALSPELFGQPATKMDIAGDKMLSAAEQISMTAVAMTQDPHYGEDYWQRHRDEFIEKQETPEDYWLRHRNEWVQDDSLEQTKSMWDRAIEAFSEGGFGPREAPIDGKELATEMSTSFKPNLEVKVPDIVADITLNIPPIRLDARAVTDAIRIVQTERLTSAARTRGAAGGSIIQ